MEYHMVAHKYVHIGWWCTLSRYSITTQRSRARCRNQTSRLRKMSIRYFDSSASQRTENGASERKRIASVLQRMSYVTNVPTSREYRMYCWSRCEPRARNTSITVIIWYSNIIYQWIIPSEEKHQNLLEFSEKEQ